MPNLIEDWSSLTTALFEGVDLDDRAAVTAKTKELFDKHKASRSDIDDKVLRHGYNSTLHEALNRVAREAKRARSQEKRVLSEEQAKQVKGRLKQHIKAKAKAKADAATIIDIVLNELEAEGVDLSPAMSTKKEG